MVTTVHDCRDQVGVLLRWNSGQCLPDHLTGRKKFLRGLDVKDPEFDTAGASSAVSGPANKTATSGRAAWARWIRLPPAVCPVETVELPFANADHLAPKRKSWGNRCWNQLRRHRWIFILWIGRCHARSAAGAARPTGQYAGGTGLGCARLGTQAESLRPEVDALHEPASRPNAPNSPPRSGSG